MGNIKANVKYDVFGDAELNKFFKDVLDNKSQREIFLNAFRKAAKPYVSTIRANLLSVIDSSRSGNLYKSIGTKATKSLLNTQLLIGFRTFGKYSGYHAHLIEHGTKKRFYKRTKNIIFKTKKNTGKLKATHFFQKSYDSDSQTIEKNIKGSMVKSLDKFVQKHNKKFAKKGYL